MIELLDIFLKYYLSMTFNIWRQRNQYSKTPDSIYSLRIRHTKHSDLPGCLNSGYIHHIYRYSLLDFCHGLTKKLNTSISLFHTPSVSLVYLSPESLGGRRAGSVYSICIYIYM